MNSFIDYYAVLGIDASASRDEIKAAFKKLALQYHPDVYKGADANERMSHILQAYQTLNNLEARRQYDAQRSEHVRGNVGVDGAAYSSTRSTTQYGSAQRNTPSATWNSSRAKSEVSPGARRDRNRHYAFPDFFPGKPMHVDLIDIDYSLTSMEAQQLVQEGLLRGSAPGTANHQYYCHRCHHHWSQAQGRDGRRTFPHVCPRCHASDWPEYLLLRCVHCSAVFESEQIRYEIGSFAYGQGATVEKGELCPPYELFPLCPYCGSAHWSPSEDARVNELRLRVARRATMLRLVWLGVALVALMLISVIALGLWR